MILVCILVFLHGFVLFNAVTSLHMEHVQMCVHLLTFHYLNLISVLFGEVREIEDEDSWRKIVLRVITVYKKGKKDLAAGKKIHVYQQKACREPNLLNNDKIVLMLKEGPLFVINKSTFALKWPGNPKKISLLKRALKEVQLGHYCG